MILDLDGDINVYYVQTLCLIFFPGETFSPREEEGPETPKLTVRIRRENADGEDGFVAYARLKLGDRVAEGERHAGFRSEYFPADYPSFSEEHVRKMAVGYAVLAVCGELLSYRPSWGMMTGVRPSKVAMEFLNAGMSKTRIKKILNTSYLVIPKKAALATDVALCEKRLIGTPDFRDCSVYISIPFCPTRCSYCSFVSYTSKRLLALIPDYLVRLGDDIRNLFCQIDRYGLHVKTVYIGGGTPTTLTAEQLRVLLSTVAELTDVTKLEEFTLEAGRPDTIDREKLAVAKEYGVTRISVNPQSLCEEVLHHIGRSHSVDEFFRAFETARESGIRTINSDLIVGLPGDSFKTYADTFDRILDLRPENVTVHTFCVKRSSDLRRIGGSVYSMRGGDAGKCVDYSQIRAEEAGYRPYYMYRQKNTVGNFENVGFSLEGAEGLYNIYMMEEVHSIFAAGAGAVSKLVSLHPGAEAEEPLSLDGTESAKHGERRIIRLFNAKYPYEYLRDESYLKKNEAIAAFYSGENP